MVLELTENEYLEFATKDVDGIDLLSYVQNKHKNWHPTKCITFLDELFKDKKYCKLVASMLTVKFQRIRSNLLKSVDSLMQQGDIDILKSVDKLLAVVLKFSQLDDDEKQINRLVIQLADGTQETFKSTNEK